MAYAPTWESVAANSAAASQLPEDVAKRRAEARVLDAIRRTSMLHVGGIYARASKKRFLSRETINVLRGFRRLRERARMFPRPPRMGVREAFFDWLDPELRDRLVAIYTHHFPREPHNQHLGIHERSRALSFRAVSSLD
jgi:hypothetical protein